MKLHRNIKIFIQYFLGPVVFIWISYSIYRQVALQPNLKDSWIQIRNSLVGNNLWKIAAVVFLMPINWLIETIKWRLIIKKLQPINFSKAFKAVLAGVSANISSPNGVGEYLGRMIFLNTSARVRGFSLNIFCSISQLLVTIAMGTAGLMMEQKALQTLPALAGSRYTIALTAAIAICLIAFLCYFNIKWLIVLVNKVAFLRRFKNWIEALADISPKLQLQLLLLSLIRYAVFLTQYYLLMQVFNVAITYAQCWWLISIHFFALSVIPSIALFTDLSLRSILSIALVGLYSANILGISLVSVGIWFINLIIPAIAGAFIILFGRLNFPPLSGAKEQQKL